MLYSFCALSFVDFTLSGQRKGNSPFFRISLLLGFEGV